MIEKLTDAQVEKIVRLRDAGDTFATIAEKLGITTSRGRKADTGGRAYAAYWKAKRRVKKAPKVSVAEQRRLKKNAAERARRARLKTAASAGDAKVS